MSIGSQLQLSASENSELFNEVTKWDPEDDSNSDIEGKWILDDDDDMTVTFKSDGTFTLRAEDIECEEDEDTDTDTGTDTIIFEAEGLWEITFTDTSDSDITLTKEYTLSVIDEDMFTLIETNLTDSTDEIFDRWSGSINENTYTHFEVTAFTGYETDSGDFSGQLTVKMTITFSSDLYFSGTYKRTRDFDSEDVEDEVVEYRMEGVK